MPKLTTIYWRDIPAQIIAKQGRQRSRVQLSQRFQEAIDRAAMRAKKISADAYLDDWRQINSSFQGDMQAVVTATAAQLEADYDEARLDKILRNKGIDPDKVNPDKAEEISATTQALA